MLFNSIEFAIFLPVVFGLYWFLAHRNLKLQNLLVVVASFLFYGWWDWRFLPLMMFSASVDFVVGILLLSERRPKRRKLLLLASIGSNLGILGFFKYFNFVSANVHAVLAPLDMNADWGTINVVLPLGISFYTFQAMSYTIDVYRRRLEPTKSIIDFFAFISFFPQLVAGPIERATQLLPQFQRPRVFNAEDAEDGTRQILWGLFKKTVIADNCGDYVDVIFANYGNYSASTLLFGVILFAFQIYCDFSGYSDIAVGAARLFGFRLMRNFSYPYLSRDVAEFWRRWHISLTTWFRDYVYVPIGGSRGSNWMKVRNVFAIFLLSGLWHGANWTFVVWGFINACLFMPLILRNRHRDNVSPIPQTRRLPRLKDALRMLTTFLLVCLTWVFFRAQDIHQALNYLTRIASPSILSLPQVFSGSVVLFIVMLVTIEWLQRDKAHPLQFDPERQPRVLRWGVYYALVFSIFLFGASRQQFIYFQF